MLSPGMLIALDVTILYIIMTPLVLYVLYVIFDSFGQSRESLLMPERNKPRKDPSLWSDKDIFQ